MSNTAMPTVGDVVAGKYRIEAVVGEGGMGTVYAASHKLTGKRVALKWMLPELARDEAAVQRFMREAQAAGRIDHPNVVDIYDVGEHEGALFLVMEFLYGETLTAAIERRELSWQQVVQLLLPALRGVGAAHDKGVIHRDLKPDNIFLSRHADGSYGEAKVVDFGISKVSSGDGQDDLRLTKTGAVVGTPYYMSPEQVRGSSEVDLRSDVYAFGVILYESLTGQVPFNAETYSALILEIATGTPQRPSSLEPQLPRELEQVVLRAMARDPDRRYRTVEELAKALEPFADGVTYQRARVDPTGPQALAVTVADTPFTSDGPVSVPRHISPLLVVLGTAALVVVGGIAGFLVLSPSEQAGSTEGALANEHLVAPAPPPPSAEAAGAQPAAALERQPSAPAALVDASTSDAQAEQAQREPEVVVEGEAPEVRVEQRRRRQSRRENSAEQPVRAPVRGSGRTGKLAVDEF